MGQKYFTFRLVSSAKHARWPKEILMRAFAHLKYSVVHHEQRLDNITVLKLIFERRRKHQKAYALTKRSDPITLRAPTAISSLNSDTEILVQILNCRVQD